MDDSTLYTSDTLSEQKIGWSSSPLGHSYRTFEAEYRAKNIGAVGKNHGKRAAAQLASSRVIWFIERCRQLELECKQLRISNEEKDKKLKRHDRDVSDLRKLINELCDKVRELKKTTKSAYTTTRKQTSNTTNTTAYCNPKGSGNQHRHRTHEHF